MKPRSSDEAIEELLRLHGTARAGEVAALAGVSRQAAHKHLRAAVEAGRLRREGAGRAARYLPASPSLKHRWPRAVLAEDRVWNEYLEPHPDVTRLSEDARTILRYAMTEMLNNAIEHSQSKEVELAFESGADRMAFEVRDEGVGIFRHLRRALKLSNDMEAVQELTKGKVTTEPKRHTGEGIFFTSKVADRFEIDSGGLLWVVDNQRGDTTVLPAAERKGTRVRFEMAREPRRTLAKIFDAYTEDFRFTRTRLVVKLFALGVEFISRSEARRLMHGLERFQAVTLDFSGVRGVGQGFVDEVFRVWANAHPRTRIEPLNMGPTVAFMVKRGLAHAR